MQRFKSPLIFIWCALALILIVRGEALWLLGNRLESDPDAYRELATGLQRGDGFALAVLYPLDDTTLKAWRPPLYPGLLAAIIPRGSPNFSMWVGGIQFVLGALTIVAVYAASRQFGSAKTTGAIAAGLILIDPILIHQSAEVMTETLAAFLVPICLLALASVDESTDRVKSLVFAGLMLGLAILCRPTFLVWAVLVVGAFASFDIARRRSIDRVILLGLAIAIVVLPWTVRNWVLLGEPVITTTHGGYTFYRANNPLYYQHLRWSPWGAAWNADEFDRSWRSQLAVELSGWGRGVRRANVSSTNLESYLDELAYESGVGAVLSEPGMFVCASAVRLTRLYGMVPWQTDPHESARMRWLRYGIGAFYFCVFALAVVGMFALGRKLFAPPWLWGTLLVLAFTLVHTFYWTDMRMRAPLVPVIAMVAAVGVERVWKYMRPQPIQASPGMAIPGLGVDAATP